jgi:hypothetical protein
VASSRKEASAKRRAAHRARAELRDHERVRARPIEPGARVKITRRCHDRRLFLTPAGAANKGLTSEKGRNFYAYTVARANQKYQTQFHGANQMGDHHHCDITDMLGNRPDFKNSVHSNLARGLNAKLGRFDSVWSGGGSCDTVTPTEDETLNDLAYTDTNPVTAGLVKWGHLWPGFTTYGWRFGETRSFVRPDWYYDPDNPDNPPVVQLTRVRPPNIFKHLSDDELSDELMRRCREIERAKQQQMKKNGRRFMGVKKLLKSKWWQKATSWEDRFERVPKVAASNKWERIAALQRNRQWEKDYAEARGEHRKGNDPVFPYGTYFLRARYGVRVAEQPP